jgi:hypothetical protein
LPQKGFFERPEKDFPGERRSVAPRYPEPTLWVIKAYKKVCERSRRCGCIAIPRILHDFGFISGDWHTKDKIECMSTTASTLTPRMARSQEVSVIHTATVFYNRNVVTKMQAEFALYLFT